MHTDDTGSVWVMLRGRIVTGFSVYCFNSRLSLHVKLYVLGYVMIKIKRCSTLLHKLNI